MRTSLISIFLTGKQNQADKNHAIIFRYFWTNKKMAPAAQFPLNFAQTKSTTFTSMSDSQKSPNR